MAIEWQDSFNLGHLEIDAQHQKLFQLVNRLLAATDKSNLTEAFAKLFQYTQAHFAHEESIMLEIGYPHIRAHLEQHSTLLSKLAHVEKFIANYTFDMVNFKPFLLAWMLNHIQTLDAQLVNYVGQK